MLKAIGLLLVAVPCVLVLGLPIAPARAELAKQCGYFDTETLTYVACAAESLTTSSDLAPTVVPKDSRDADSSTSDDSDAPCYDENLEVLPAASSVWSHFIPAGANPADYQLVMANCEAAGRPGSIFAVRVRNNPPPSATVVAREAIAKLPVPLPAIQVGPNIQRVAVNIPVWLWVSNPQVVTASATDRTVTVTATAALQSVTWSMGEPRAKPFTCQGAGAAPWAGADLWHPPCGYTYRLRSLPSRTGGAGVWQVTATASWAITWQANTGASGTDTVSTRSTLGLNVGEYRTVIVAGNG